MYKSDTRNIQVKWLHNKEIASFNGTGPRERERHEYNYNK